jgi:hypothetical protein
MSVLGTLAWVFGVYLKYNMIYGTVAGLVLALSLSSWQNSSITKDKNCKNTYSIGSGFLVAVLVLTLIPAVGQFFLKEWAQSLIDQNA